MLRIEALADAIAYTNESYLPESEAYKLRNPGLLKARTSNNSLAQLANADDQCRRIFVSYKAGYQALVYHLEFLCTRYKKMSLAEALASFGFKESKTFTAIDFLQRSIGDASIDAKIPLSFFLE